jgi:rod shape-determining protein MreD
MASTYLLVFKRFIFLVLLQVLIFNKFDLFGIYNPYICLVFILTFPVKMSKISFMVVAFAFGFTLDLFSNSLGLNTTACLTVAFLRSYIMNFIFGGFFDRLGLKLIKNYVSDSSFSQKILYVSSIILIHHFILFSLEAFSLKHISTVLNKTLITYLLSGLFCTTLIYFMIENEK